MGERMSISYHFGRLIKLRSEEIAVYPCEFSVVQSIGYNALYEDNLKATILNHYPPFS